MTKRLTKEETAKNVLQRFLMREAYRVIYINDIRYQTRQYFASREAQKYLDASVNKHIDKCEDVQCAKERSIL